MVLIKHRPWGFVGHLGRVASEPNTNQIWSANKPSLRGHLTGGPNSGTRGGHAAEGGGHALPGEARVLPRRCPGAAQPWNPMELSGSQIAALPLVARTQGTGLRASLPPVRTNSAENTLSGSRKIAVSLGEKLTE